MPIAQRQKMYKKTKVYDNFSLQSKHTHYEDLLGSHCHH